MQRFTRNFLRILAENEILQFEDVKNNVGTYFHDGINSNIVLITLVPSFHNKEILDYTVTYFLKEKPTNYIEATPSIRINPKIGYSNIIIKADKKIPGYDNFYVDKSLNVLQMRTLQFTYLPIIKGELEKLLELNKAALFH